MKGAVVGATYRCVTAGCRRLRRHQHSLTSSLVDLEAATSIEWRPRGLPWEGPQLQSVYVSTWIPF